MAKHYDIVSKGKKHTCKLPRWGERFVEGLECGAIIRCKECHTYWKFDVWTVGHTPYWKVRVEP